MGARDCTVHAFATLMVRDACLNPHRQLRRLERARARARAQVEQESLRMRPELPPPTPTRPRELSPDRKLEIRLADWVCRYCLKEPATTVDHVLAWSKGGSDDESNLVGCCGPCNVRKGDMSVEEAGMVLHPPLRWSLLGVAAG